MATYTPEELSGQGTPTEALTAGTEYVFTLLSSNILLGSAYFTFETVRNANGFYDSTSPTNAVGTLDSASGVQNPIQDLYIFSEVINSITSSFTFTPTENVAVSSSYLRTTGGVSLDITPSGPVVTPFQMTVDTTKTGTSSTTSMTIPFATGTFTDCVVDWGDSTTTTVTTSGNVTHDYGATNTAAVIKISGAFPGLIFNQGGDKLKLSSIDQWGTNVFTSMANAFAGCSNMIGTFTVAPNLGTITSLYQTFRATSLFNTSIDNWDVSNITNMQYMFYSLSTPSIYNQPLNSWNVSNVTNMYGMFYGAVAFNQNLNSWDVSNVTNFANIFNNATSFNGNISSWIPSSAINMSSMLRTTSAFTGDLSGWATYTGNVTNMSAMFLQSIHNSNIGSWNVSNVTDMSYMFYGSFSTSNFNQNIGSWDVSSVIDMNNMFIGATAFNQDIGSWNVSNVANFTNFLATGTSINFSAANLDAIYNGWSSRTVQSGITITFGTAKYTTSSQAGRDILTGGTNVWNITDGGVVPVPFQMTVDTTETGTSSNTSMTIPFSAGTFTDCVVDWGDSTTTTVTTSGNVTHDYGATTTAAVIKISGAFPGLYFNNGGDKLKLSSIDTWGTNVFTTINQSFYGCSNMVGTFTDYPNLSVVDSLARRTFFGCELFDSDLRGWDMTNITDMQFMLANCTAFGTTNGNVSDWDVSNTQVFNNLFENCTNFDGDVDSWDVSSGTSFSKMFATCTSFQSNTLASWRPTSGTNFKQMFYNATNASFTPNVNNWGITTAATNLTYMFYNMPSFNSTDLTGWDVSSVNNMVYMFHGCSSFNGDVSTWDVSSVSTMSNMFRSCSSFNQNLNSWDVSSVTDMSRMFWGATIFNGNISSWIPSSCLNFERTFADANNFNSDISSWNVSSATRMDYMFNNATAFNSNLSWNVSNVTTMFNMFAGCTNFGLSGIGGDISSWTPTSCITMERMFQNATNFNSDISGWDVSSVTNMKVMFYAVTAFDQNLGSWNVSSVTDFSDFMTLKTPSTFSTANLSAIYDGWSSRTVSTGETITFGTAKYNASSQAGRDILTGGTNLWNITDGGGIGVLDTYTGASVGYSLRNLKSSTTNVVKIRRSSDNAEQDFTAAGITDGTLTTFTGTGGTDDGFVTIWYDQSGNGNNSTQSTANLQPKLVSAGVVNLENGKPAILYDTSGAQTLSFTTRLTNNRSVFATVNPLTPASSYKQAIMGDNIVYNYLGGVGTQWLTTLAPNAIKQGNDFVNGVSSDLTTTSRVANQQVLISMIHTTSTGISSRISQDRAITTRSWQGNYQELIVYPTDQTSNLTSIDSNINTHYSIYTP